MLKGDNINGYIIQKDFETSGQSKFSTGVKDGTLYFVKEFFRPKYPTKGSPGSDKMKTLKRKKCEEFEAHHNPIVALLNEKCGPGGNLIYPIEFFRSDASYYKVYEKVDVSTIGIKELSKLKWNEKLIIFITITKSLSILHGINLVHGDLKPDNILIKRTKKDFYTTKLIDFDNAYFSSDPPSSPDDVVGDQVYYSPELAKYLIGNETPLKSSLTAKSDIFSLGLIFHQFCTSKVPAFNNKYQYCWEAILNKGMLKLAPSLDPEFSELLDSMTQLNADLRPTISQVFGRLKALQKKEKDPHTTTLPFFKESRTETSTVSLRGKLLPTTKPDLKKKEKPESGTLRGKLFKKKN